MAHTAEHSQQYQLSSQQLATAAAFSQSLAGGREDSPATGDSGVTEARERTAALLAGAADKLTAEADEASPSAVLHWRVGRGADLGRQHPFWSMQDDC